MEHLNDAHALGDDYANAPGTVQGDAPILPAYRVGSDTYVIWCTHCRRWHRHGAAMAGHRVAHCTTPRSPYSATGYVLEDAGPATDAILADMRRRKPRGVAR
ncbi:conserved protein of unknown function (plasmid) [Rhodovastum atsumiense]|uniref:Uncharacterized protein n=1 Tax=Rhodovastum atsumiense TaxID=504468 RepID=A0A5M6III8_9PROT|nr:hypothetical protein [Rhodovastum atsumiense]KAA5608083.1 hypothetical protein F1189_30800 [Rhodovastum atsumiense]CAH2606531.1 conserved protein of unknown function [Rhodovastum atsumiense]